VEQLALMVGTGSDTRAIGAFSDRETSLISKGTYVSGFIPAPTLPDSGWSSVLKIKPSAA